MCKAKIYEKQINIGTIMYKNLELWSIQSLYTEWEGKYEEVHDWNGILSQ